MNTCSDSYAVQIRNIKKAGKPHRYLAGFKSRSEAENKLTELFSKDTYTYKVVYIRKYVNPMSDKKGFVTIDSITEIPEYYSI